MKLKTVTVACCTLIVTLLAAFPLISTAMTAPAFGAVERLTFNRRAAELYLPLFWREDTNKDGIIQPDELAVLIGYGKPHENQRDHWVDANHHFTRHFELAYHQIASVKPITAKSKEGERLKLVREELAQNRPTLVETDLSPLTPGEVNMVHRLMQVAKHIEDIYARQKGVFGLQALIPNTDLASLMLFYRNQNPFCEAPLTRDNPTCSALASHPAQLSGLYPVAIQKDKNFCDQLAKESNAAELMDHFSVVVKGKQVGTYQAVPYNVAYRKDMEAIATELEATASDLDDSERAFRNYLRVTAESFRSNNWEPSNRAWAAMSATNSKWYARIAPDEVYYEPCAWKAGFALQLARINTASLAWQQKLAPLKNEMEHELAVMAGAPYSARDVKFKVPDFIDVILNAGDQRMNEGGAIGQSLPNWGSVAESSGRTVSMSNLFNDVDSNNSAIDVNAAVFCSNTNRFATPNSEDQLVTSMLHEVAHNLGPTTDYKLDGRTMVQAFGGPLGATLEELKAETSSMFLVDWLKPKGFFNDERVRQIHTYQTSWDFGHISRGMYTPDGKTLNYSHLAAIQLGWMMDHGAMAWHVDQMAANGKDKGCLEIDYDKLPQAIHSLETEVLQIKGQANKQRAEQLKAKYVDGTDDFAQLKSIITARLLRSPKATLVYSIRD